MDKFTGRVWVLGDDIDTDIIIPTEYLALKTIDDMKQYGFFSSSSGTCRTDPEGGYHCSRKELWLRFVKRTGTGDHQGNGCAVCDRQIICKDLFP